MIVVADANVAIKWYVNEIHSEKAEALLTPAYDVHVPELIYPEFGNIVWKKVRQNLLTQGEGAGIIKAFDRSWKTLHSNQANFASSWAGAISTGRSVYDWTYLSLAISLSCRLVTADGKFYRALENTSFQNSLIWIEDL